MNATATHNCRRGRLRVGLRCYRSTVRVKCRRGFHGNDPSYTRIARWKQGAFHSRRRLKCVLLKSMAPAVRFLPHGEKGELQIRAPSPMQAYFGDAAATVRGLGFCSILYK